MAWGSRRSNVARAAAARKRKGGGWIVGLLGVIFTGVGLAFAIGLTVLPMLRWQQAQSWPAVECQVLESQVHSHDSDDGTTYSIHIRYAYAWEGRPITSDQYNFVSGSSSGRSGKQRVVDQYPPGSLSTCYVDPAHPETAVLSRDFSLGYLIGLFGLIFLFVGVLCLVGAFKTSPATTAIARPPTMPATGAIQLKPAEGPVVRLVVMVCLALFWNGIVGVFLWSIISDWEDTSIFLPLFMIPFVAVGLGLLWACVYYTLALANPRATLRMSPPTLRLGETATLEWTLSGAAHRLQGFEVWLVGQEEATYRRGTDTHTDRQVFERIPVLQAQATEDLRLGRAQFAVPEFTMHSYAADNNKISWKLEVHGVIARWPDLKEEFAITVTPLEVAS